MGLLTDEGCIKLTMSSIVEPTDSKQIRQTGINLCPTACVDTVSS